MQSVYFASDYLKAHSKRYVCLRLICFFTLFIYGILNLLEKNIHNVTSASELIVLFVSIKTLISMKTRIYAMHRQLELARLVVRFFDLPANITNFFKFINDELNVSSNKDQDKKIKVMQAFKSSI